MKRLNLLMLLLPLFCYAGHPIEEVDVNGLGMASLGVFKPSDPRLEGLKWANWGSRPYEYLWVSKVVPVNNKYVIDLGIGIPSDYNWYKYVATSLSPTFYAGIDCDGRIKDQLESGPNFELKYMNMASLEFNDKAFDVAYCISTFEHIPYTVFMETIKEAHRVLKDDGLLVLTLDERWDKDKPYTHDNSWNDLEQSLAAIGKVQSGPVAFGLPEFLMLIKDYFVPVNEDLVIDAKNKTIYSNGNQEMFYQKQNQDPSILNSGLFYNSCVSFAVVKKKPA